jgi:putative intracellular protease/amidase
MGKPNVLIVVTSHAELGSTGEKTGFWLEELAVPYRELVRAGAEVTIASPKGGAPPADPKSAKSEEPDVAAFLADEEAKAKLANTKKLSDIQATYDAVFLAGGHGVMWDLVSDPDLAKLLSDTYARGAVVAAVCHGPAGLVLAKKPNGEPLVAGHRVAGFSDEEERGAKLEKIVPFLLETKLKELGGKYERGPMWKSFVVRDRNLVTGQNPASSRAAAKETLAAIQTR